MIRILKVMAIAYLLLATVSTIMIDPLPTTQPLAQLPLETTSVGAVPIVTVEITPSISPIAAVDVIAAVESPEVSRSGERPGAVQMEATAYTATGNRTSTGTWPKEGRTVSVDPHIIPYGSRLIIDGVSGYIAEDCGGAVTAGIIDIYMDSEDACFVWGRRDVEVVVEEKYE